MRVQFEYGTARVRDLRARVSHADKTGLPSVDRIQVNDEDLMPTPRFWRSFFGRYRISDNVFRYFSHAEVFERINAQAPSESFRYCIERKRGRTGRLLAISNVNRPLRSASRTSLSTTARRASWIKASRCWKKDWHAAMRSLVPSTRSR